MIDSTVEFNLETKNKAAAHMFFHLFLCQAQFIRC